MSWLENEEREILQGVRELLKRTEHLKDMSTALGTLTTTTTELLKLVGQLAKAEQVLNEKLDEVLVLLEPPPLVAFVVSITINGPDGSPSKEQSMAAAKKATVDFQVLDNGTVKCVATPVDAMGNPPNPPGLPAGSSAPAWKSSDDSAISIALDPADASGLTLIGTPLKLATGITISVSCALADGTTITGDGDPIDVVAGPAGGFAVSES